MASASGLKKPKPGDKRLPSMPSKDLPSCSPAASSLLFQLSPVELIDITASILQQTVDANAALLGGRKQPRSEITRFHTRDPPAITIKAYLARLLQLAPFPLDALLLAVAYINRLTHRQLARSTQSKQLRALFPQHPPPSNPNAIPMLSLTLLKETGPAPPLTPWTVHRLVLGTLAIAAKYTSDAYIGQRRLAKVGGITVKELFELETEVFDQLVWSCYTSAAELQTSCSQLWRLSDKSQQTEVHTPRATRTSQPSPDHLQIERMALSRPQEDSRPSVSPTPAMSDGDSESSGMASSLDDSGTADTSQLDAPYKLNRKVSNTAPVLVPMPIQ